MQRNLCVIILCLLTIGCQSNGNISAYDVKRLIDEGWAKGIIVDVRSQEEYAKEHIPGSISIPLETLEEKSKEMSKKIPIIVYCKSGCNRSQKAYKLLKSQGFKQVMNMVGGIDEWYKIGGKIEGNYKIRCLPVWELGHGCED